VLLYLVAKPSHVGADVDVLAYSLHCPMACSRQKDSQSFLTGADLSCHIVVGGGAFSGHAKLPG
jgi:hypothetical protein